MNARMLAIAALGALTLSGCSYPAPEETNKSEKIGAEKDTTAELLIGRWQQNTQAGIKIVPGAEMVVEFTRDGRALITCSSPQIGVRVSTGTYRVEGNRIQFIWDPDANGPGDMFNATILRVTDEELDIEGDHQRNKPRDVLKRIGKKQRV